MFHIVSKILTFFIMPQGIIIILLAYAIYTKNRTKSRRSIIAALIFFYFFSAPFVIDEFARLWEVPSTPISTVKKHDVGIILTGGAILNQKLPAENIFLGERGDRMGQIFQLYKAGKIGKILISGGEVTVFGESQTREIDQIARYLALSGVPKEDIYLEDLSTNTRENAINSAKILKEKFPGQSYILVTSAFHMKRSVKCFEKAGIAVTPFGADFLSSERRWAFVRFMPGGGNMYHVQLLFREIIGYVSYWIFGWV